MPGIHETQLVNTIGHAAGAIIFGIFLFLMFRDRSATRLRGSVLSVTAAGLAFLWNLGSLGILFTSNVNSGRTELLIFFCFSVLSFLPAVLLHLSLDRSLAPIIAAGYGLSVIAVWMHLREIFHPNLNYHQRALLLITVGFGILTAVSVVVALRGDNNRRAAASRIFGAMCAFLLAMSFVHFGFGHPSQLWSKELAFHHAGIPLALFVLLQDYRFVLLDAFIRFLTNALLAAILTFAIVRIAFYAALRDQALYSNSSHEALLLVSISLLLIVFAIIRSRAQEWLTKVVFRRKDLNKALQDIHSRAASFGDEAKFLEWAIGELARFMSTDRAEQVSEASLGDILSETDSFLPIPSGDLPAIRHLPDLAWVEAIVPLRLGHGDLRYVLLGRRQGGRRYLSEDLNSLSRFAAAMVEQVERIRKTEMHRLVSQAELRALQSQINPHFLFNALNTLYGIIPREAAGARKTVMDLAEIFRHFFRSEKTFVPLSEELEIVKAYLDIERLRLGPRLEIDIDIDEAAMDVPIPILSIQPLVENAIKHGIFKKAGPGLLRLKAKLLDNELAITVEDNGNGMTAWESVDQSARGIGLSNVQRRLQLCFGPGSGVVIKSNTEGTEVKFAIPIPRAANLSMHSGERLRSPFAR